MTVLSQSARVRYSRQMKLTQFGERGQKRLLDARILLIGAGGLGSPIGIYLAGAGVGTIGIIDPDRVDISNLHRQIGFTTHDAAKATIKANALRIRLLEINPEVCVKAKCLAINEQNALSLVKGYDLVVDGSDNLTTKFLVADACHHSSKALISGAVHSMSCQLALFVPQITACYRCLFSEPPEKALASCNDEGVLGTVAGTAALLMATEALKFLSGVRPTILGKMLIYDAESQTMRTVKISRNENCRICSFTGAYENGRSGTNEMGHPASTNITNTKNIQEVTNISQAKQLLDLGAVLIDVREESEFQEGSLPSAINYPLSKILLDANSGSFQIRQGPIILFCQTGSRSLRAFNALRAALDFPIYNLSGTLERWLTELN